mgnify:FL=1
MQTDIWHRIYLQQSSYIKQPHVIQNPIFFPRVVHYIFPRFIIDGDLGVMVLGLGPPGFLGFRLYIKGCVNWGSRTSILTSDLEFAGLFTTDGKYSSNLSLQRYYNIQTQSELSMDNLNLWNPSHRMTMRSRTWSMALFVVI